MSTLGLLLTAVFILNILQRIFYGPPNEHWSKLPDLTVRERWLLAPALVLMLVAIARPAAIVTLPSAFFVLYPISLLSALEANTIWVPLTMPILSSLWRWWWCWARRERSRSGRVPGERLSRAARATRRRRRA